MNHQMNTHRASSAGQGKVTRGGPMTGALALVPVVLLLSACATPKPFDPGEVRPGYVACADFADIDRAETGNLPEGCIDAAGLDYEVVISAERYTLVDLTVPTEDASIRAYILRRAL